MNATVTATTFECIPQDAISSVCIRRTGSKRAHSYSNWLDIVDCRRKFGDTIIRWDGVYGCYVSTGINSKLATMMVYVNREQE